MGKSSAYELKRLLREVRQGETERRELLETLREMEERYRTLTDHLPVGIFRSTPGPKGRFIEINPTLLSLLGYDDREELFGKDVAQIYQNPADRLGFSNKMTERGFVEHEELTLRKRDGTPIVVSETAIAVRDAAGAIAYFQGIVEDITERKNAERELLLQQAYLQSLFNSAPEAIVLHDMNDRVINVNDEFSRLFGYAREDTIGKTINELVVPGALHDEGSLLSYKVIHGERVEVDSRRRRKDGTLVDVSILGAPILYDGKQMGVYAIYRDISARKASEDALRVQTTYLERLFNSAPEAIALHDDQDRIVNVNPEFTRLFGYGRSEAIGKPINDLVVPPELREEGEEVSQRVIRGERVELDTRRRRKDGTLIDVSVLGAPVIHEGKQIGDYAIYRDITERTRAQEELRIQKTYLERLFNSAPEAIVLHDNTDRVVNVNEEFTRMFGYTREEVLGRPINELVVPARYESESAGFSRAVLRGERVEAESQRKRKDGTLIEVSILGAPIVHEGKQMGVYAIYRDITDRKRAEESRVRMREESRMARNIQMNFLPSSDPVVEGYDVAGRSVPAENVGGDYFDFIPLDEHRLVIGVGDVSGKRLPASLVMANLQATIRSLALFDPDRETCLARANTLLFRSTDARTFISLFYAILDTATHSIIYANAGQDPPILFSQGQPPRPLRTHGIALGIRERVSYEAEEISLLPGDRLLIFSDGILEAMNGRMVQFGPERLLNVVEGAGELRSAEVITRIVEAVGIHVGAASQLDDMTAVFLTRLPPAS